MVSQVVVLLTATLVRNARLYIFREESMCRFYNRDEEMKVSTFCELSHFRAEEKRILDSVMGPAVYDSRIRPAGINGTGKEIMQNRRYRYLNRKWRRHIAVHKRS